METIQMAEKPPTTTHEVMMEMATEVVKHAIERGVSTCARRTWEEGWGPRGSRRVAVRRRAAYDEEVEEERVELDVGKRHRHLGTGREARDEGARWS